MHSREIAPPISINDEDMLALSSPKLTDLNIIM